MSKLEPAVIDAVERSQKSGRRIELDLETGTLVSAPAPTDGCDRFEAVESPIARVVRMLWEGT